VVKGVRLLAPRVEMHGLVLLLQFGQAPAGLCR
jgi:hypothetical protein